MLDCLVDCEPTSLILQLATIVGVLLNNRHIYQDDSSLLCMDSNITEIVAHGSEQYDTFGTMELLRS
jgi:hypothetical protein